MNLILPYNGVRNMSVSLRKVSLIRVSELNWHHPAVPRLVNADTFIAVTAILGPNLDSTWSLDIVRSLAIVSLN